MCAWVAAGGGQALTVREVVCAEQQVKRLETLASSRPGDCTTRCFSKHFSFLSLLKGTRVLNSLNSSSPCRVLRKETAKSPLQDEN